MTKKKTKKRTPSSFASEAALQSLLRFGPEDSALGQLAQSASDQYVQAVRAARGGAEATSQLIDKSRPQVEQAYTDATGLANERNSQIAADLAKLGGVADSFKASAGIESAHQLNNISAAKANAIAGLVDRKTSAREGVAYAVENARKSLTDDLSKIFSRKQDLAQEKGAFTVLTTQQLSDAADEAAAAAEKAASDRDAALQRSYIGAGMDPSGTGILPVAQAKLDAQAAARKQRSRGRTSATGARLLSPDKHEASANVISEIQSLVGSKYRGKLARAQIVKKLVAGRPQQSIKVDPDTGQKLQNPVTLPAIPAYKANILMTAALDQALDGHISRKTQTELGRRGYSVDALGLTTYAQWKKKNAKGPAPTAVKNVLFK